MLEKPNNSVGAGVNLNASGITGVVGLQRGRVGFDVTGGTTWKKNWFAGAKIKLDF